MSLMLLVSACSIGNMISPPPAPPPQPPRFTPPATLAPRAEATAPAQVRDEIARWFTDAGYKSYQVAALVEHARIESGFEPCAAGPAGLHYTFQWGGLRLRRLREFSGGPACPSLDVQLAFADNELRNQPAYWCFWRATSEPTALTALRRGFGRGHC